MGLIYIGFGYSKIALPEHFSFVGDRYGSPYHTCIPYIHVGHSPSLIALNITIKHPLKNIQAAVTVIFQGCNR